MGASLGSMLAAPLVAWAILTHSWQFAFVLTGALGLVWVALWLLFYQSPAKHTALSAAERDYILAGQEQPPRRRRAAAVDRAIAARSGISGASRFRGSSPIRPGAR